MKIIKIIICSLMLSIIFPYYVKSQTKKNSDSPELGWLTLSAGFIGNKDFFGFGGNLEASYYSKIGLLSLRYIDAARSTMETTTFTNNNFIFINVNRCWNSMVEEK